MRNKFFVYLFILLATLSIDNVFASGSEKLEIKKLRWTFEGVLGYYDRASLRRGFQVYNEVCAACHSISLVTYRNLMDIGFSEKEVKKIAGEKTVRDGPNEEGEMFDRPARVSDIVVPPYPNRKAAQAANNGAYPPDMSLSTKKYADRGGSNYIYSVLTGYREKAPDGITIPDGKYYNVAFEGHVISMPPPLSDGIVTFADGTEATLDQMSRDISNFFQWTSEPELEARKKLGMKFMVFLVFTTVVCYLIKRKVWANVK